MLAIAKIVHVLALGLWFGAVVVFTFVGWSLFDTFWKETIKPADERPFWLPVPPRLEKAPPDPMFRDMFPDPLRREQGSRLAGAAIGPMFRVYYILQVVCGVLALLTALVWLRAGRIHRRRVGVLLWALAGAGVGWWMEGRVQALRVERDRLSDVVLLSDAPSVGEEADATVALATFGMWHRWSLSANLVTLVFVTTAMALTAFLPAREPEKA